MTNSTIARAAEITTARYSYPECHCPFRRHGDYDRPTALFVWGRPMDSQGVKVYGYRWVMLGAFMLVNITMQILWICFAPVTGPAASYYHVTDFEIGLLAISFMIVYIPLARSEARRVGKECR